MSKVSLECGDNLLSCIALRLPDEMGEGTPVDIIFKETEVALCTGDGKDTSIANRIPCTVISVKSGVIVSEVLLETADGRTFTSIITSDSLKRLNIQAGSSVTALIKSNEISLERKKAHHG